MVLRGRCKEAYDALSDANSRAFNDVFLMANQVLCKEPSNNGFLRRYVSGETVGRPNILYVLFQLLKYYIKSFLHFFFYSLKFIEYMVANNRFDFPDENKELLLIDTFFLVDNIRDADAFVDPYFPGLEDVLKKRKIVYAYLPVFYSTKRVTGLYDILKILKRQKVSLLTEYQLLSMSDLAYIFFFLISYPFHVLRFLKTLEENSYDAALLKYELIDTLDHVTFYSFSRYAQGKRIAKLPYARIKIISWYENKALNKTLYKGLRSVDDKVSIYGAQLLLYSSNDLNIRSDEKELAFGIVPDKIVVNGPFYMPENTGLNYAVGPSLRYSHIFRGIPHRKKQEKILVLLPQNEGTDGILSLLNNDSDLFTGILVKPHPAADKAAIGRLLPQGLILVDDNIHDLFEGTKIVIGAASGTLIEAVSLGIPVIAVRNRTRLDFNPLPEYGKGIVWDEADTTELLVRYLRKFEQLLQDRPDEIAHFAGEYRKMFFCEPTEENIADAFEL